MKIYQVNHLYDVDGGFGDAVGKCTLIATFMSKHDAEIFVQKFSNFHCYEKPYAPLYCGELEITEIEIMPEQENDNWVESFDAQEFWWLDDET